MAPTLPSALPDAFTYRDALVAGVTKHDLYALRESHVIEPVARGLYRRAQPRDFDDLDRIELARRVPRATLCLATALAHHGLTDATPVALDVALPTGSHRPRLVARVAWHQFDRTTFDVGRESLPVGTGVRVGIYNPERSIIDAFRMRHLEGDDLAYIALRRWLRRPGSSPGALYEMARRFPCALRTIAKALEILQYE